MTRPLVTPVESAPEPDPPVLILFNEKSGPAQVIDLVGVRHSFTESEVWATTDEQGRPAWLLALTCETATPNELFELIGSRLPDYIQARRFPPSRLPQVRAEGEQLS
jgi:hypothetical protein